MNWKIYDPETWESAAYIQMKLQLLLLSKYGVQIVWNLLWDKLATAPGVAFAEAKVVRFMLNNEAKNRVESEIW